MNSVHITNFTDGLEIYKAMASEVRIGILELILNNESINLNDIAKELSLTNGALTAHIKKLEGAGLICRNTALEKGNDKIYKICFDRLVTEFHSVTDPGNTFQAEINPGLYTDYNVFPTCGLALANDRLGELDNPKYFSHPNHVHADMIWFASGYVEYVLPSILPSDQVIDRISISMEIASEAPGSNDNFPSDIYFYMNNNYLGYWTSPGDFGNVKGRYTPEWWPITSNQYGILKTITIDNKGTFIDAERISSVTIESLKLTSDSILRFRFAVPKNAKNVGGLTIYGRNFGNFDQGIKIKIDYRPKSSTLFA